MTEPHRTSIPVGLPHVLPLSAGAALVGVYQPTYRMRGNTTVWIRKYVRADGTEVKGHSRSSPGSRTQLTTLAVITLVVLGYTNGAEKSSPTEQSGVTYPVRLPVTERDPLPQPSVSYPIPWDRSP